MVGSPIGNTRLDTNPDKWPAGQPPSPPFREGGELGSETVLTGWLADRSACSGRAQSEALGLECRELRQLEAIHRA